MEDKRNIDGCQLALPEGLKELMSDITREVLRAQPQNVYEFIATYLSALIEVRNNVSIAAQVCDDIHDCSCHPELDDELRKIGLVDEDVVTAVGVIGKFFENGGKETSLFNQLSRKTNIEDSQLGAVQEAVQRAFKKHRLNKSGFYQMQNKALKHNCVDNVSSVSLAGSFVNLPKYTPYSVHADALSDISEGVCDRHTPPIQDNDVSNKSASDAVNSLYKNGVLDRENVIRFKSEIIKYINDDERQIEEFIEDAVSGDESDALSIKTDSHCDTSSSDE